MCQGDSYKFHAAGREDIDVWKLCCLYSLLCCYCNYDVEAYFFQVRMLGTGRPFLVEIQNARQVPSEELIKEMETKINSLDNKLVRIISNNISCSKVHFIDSLRYGLL